MEMVYRFSHSARLPKGTDAQSVGDQLSRLRSDLGRGFTPSAIVKDAQDEDSPLHVAFADLWDLTAEEALQRTLEQRASYLVRHVRIVVVRPQQEGPDKLEERPAFYSVVERQSEERRYMPVIQVLSDEEYREQALEEAFRYFMAGRERFRDFQELARIFAAIDRTADQRRKSVELKKAA